MECSDKLDDGTCDTSRDLQSPALASEFGFLRHASRDALRRAMDEAMHKEAVDSNRALIKNVVHLRREEEFTHALRQEMMCCADKLSDFIHCEIRKELSSSMLTQQKLAESVLKLRDELIRYADIAIEKVQRELKQATDVIRQELGIAAAEKASEHYESLQAFILRLSQKVNILERNQMSVCLHVDSTDEYVELRNQVTSLAAEFATTRESYKKLNSFQLSSAQDSDSLHTATIQPTTHDRFGEMQGEISRLSEIVAMCAASSANAASAVAGAIQQTEANIIRQDLAELRREVPVLKAGIEGCASVDECDVLQEWCRALHKEFSSKYEELVVMCHRAQGQGARCVCPDPASFRHEYEHVRQELSERCAHLQDQLQGSLMRHERASHKLAALETSLEIRGHDYHRLAAMTTAQSGALLRHENATVEETNRIEAALANTQGGAHRGYPVDTTSSELRIQEYHRLEEMLCAQSNALLRHEEAAQKQSERIEAAVSNAHNAGQREESTDIAASDSRLHEYQRLEEMLSAHSGALLRHEEVAQTELNRIASALQSQQYSLANFQCIPSALQRYEEYVQQEYSRFEAAFESQSGEHQQLEEMADAKFRTLQQHEKVAQKEAREIEAALESRLEEMTAAQTDALRRHENVAQDEWQSVEESLHARHDDHVHLKEMAAKRASRVGLDGADALTAAPPVEDITNLVADMEEIMEDFKDEIRKTCKEHNREQDTALTETRDEMKKDFKKRLEKCKNEFGEALEDTSQDLEACKKEIAEIQSVLEEHEQDTAAHGSDKLLNACKEEVEELRKEVQDLDSEQAIEIEELRNGIKDAVSNRGEVSQSPQELSIDDREKDDEFRCDVVPGETPQEKMTRVMNYYLSKMKEQKVPLPENIVQIKQCDEHPDCYLYTFGSRKLHIQSREKDNEIILQTRVGGGHLLFDHYAKRNGRKEKSHEEKNAAKRVETASSSLKITTPKSQPRQNMAKAMLKG